MSLSWSNFGQRKQKYGALSPNPKQIRTEKVEMLYFESEPGATSDRESRNTGFRVRTWSNFGQRKQKCGF
ncbi:hypothetical protein [Cytobacillus firmus]|uniref:hypothetical protein n=1 Tax=Cytobacillus firmus TaxID=1399 RepID=UPI001CFEA4CF|nr:hypothetical protein [Cytobacillus firmus]